MVVGLQVFFGVDVGDAVVAAVSGIAFFVRLVLLSDVVVVVDCLVEERGGRCCGCSSTGRGRKSNALADFVA